ncbi:Uncharacterized protein TCM_013502 [Theobroma cacao]|uniref:Putative plant transposon protein domain-containing protein n=1 Tax=Theobroma cacao TaxID=3641 RepID=A0A061FWG2_THECC|nr:Uncharacterized protein TCM_013502 [Theobroma cacao]
MIDKRPWQNFCASLAATNIPLVREFYANAVEATYDFVFGRSKLVPFSSHAINEFYETTDIKSNGYGQYLGEHEDWDDIIHILYEESAQCRFFNNTPVSFKKNVMKPTYKIWLYFVASKLLPTTHTSNVMKDRAIPIHSIMIGCTIDIGHIFYKP